MNQPHEPITEIDLLAYADGGLNGDPQREADVEQYLRDNPKMSARVKAFIRQNEEIRTLYDPVLSEPVPERLRMTLDPVSRSWLPQLARGAVAATILFATGATGWYLGRSSTDAVIWQRDAVVHSALDSYRQSMNASAPVSGTVGTLLPSGSGQTDLLGPQADFPVQADTGSRPTSWISGHVALQMRLPDLSQDGFRMIDNQTIETDNGNAIRVSYHNDQGQKLVLMLHPRWRTGISDIEIDDRQGVALASWADGPLAYGLASDGGAQQIFDMAQRIRNAMREPGTSKPALTSDPRSFPQIEAPGRGASEQLIPGDMIPQQRQPTEMPVIDEPVANADEARETGIVPMPLYQ
ncbi:anti-sigma factor family protein [Thalassospira lucentensis]|uniref:anti-sigma factor family protein n=1 Tax=Thalassospira lucentensis TaxID=168935 RepID=UPI003D2EF9F9